MWEFQIVVLQRTTRNCCKMHAARVARLFFLVQPIRFLIYDVDVVVDVADPEVHKYPVCCNFLSNVILLLLRRLSFNLSDERLHL